MKLIPLTKGKVALVDDEDYDRVKVFKWYFEHGYARRSIYLGDYKTKYQYLHRFIMGDPVDGVDHRDGDGLNCRRKNLRLATPQQNQRNRKKQRNNTSGFTGVTWHNQAGKWMAQMGTQVKGEPRRCINLGLFSNKRDAAKAYRTAALEIYGEFART